MENSMFVEREELMVSPFGGIPQLRKSHFLNPIVSSVEGPNLKLPSLRFSSESEWPLKVSFKGYRPHQNKWKKWVETMEPVHHSIWKAAGIHEAVMASVYNVQTEKDLILGLAERWCCETNTFVFPWGEATITLEDMIILGGFAVLGGPVLSPAQSPEFGEIEENLEKARIGLIGLKDNNHNRWLYFFMNSGSSFEHEAFLSLWLSRFVFPGKLGAHVFPIAVNLARGKRLALAPVVLASIYRDLGLLKQAMLRASSNETSSRQILELWAPLFFVQVWALERLLPLRPEQARNYNMVSGVRIERWHNVKRSGVISVRTTIDSSGETFQWRPYALAVEGWLVPKFYKDNEEWATIEGQNLDHEIESLVRCLRVAELVGLDCQEPYRPNRVAMQFGYDQDFPKWIPRSPPSPEHAWDNYSRPIDPDLTVYYPSRLFDPDVTAEYLKWWRKDVLYLADAFIGLSRGRRSKRRLEQLSNINDNPVSAPKLKQVKVEINRDVCDVHPSLPAECQLKQVENYPDVPPGFPPKSAGENDKNLSVVVSQTMACDIVPPGLVVNPIAEERVSQTVACEAVPPGSTERHTDCEHDTNENDSNRGERASCDDLIMAIELRLSRLERQVPSRRRC